MSYQQQASGPSTPALKPVTPLHVPANPVSSPIGQNVREIIVRRTR